MNNNQMELEAVQFQASLYKTGSARREILLSMAGLSIENFKKGNTKKSVGVLLENFC